MILRPRQTVFVERSLAALEEYGNSLGVAPTGCHAAMTPILLFNGAIKNVEDIKVGDLLMGPNSQPRDVLKLHRGQDALFKICPEHGEPFVVNSSHILSLKHAKNGHVINMCVSDYLDQLEDLEDVFQLYRVGVTFPDRRLPSLDPYFLGLFLACGKVSYGAPTIETNDPEVVLYCEQLASRSNTECVLRAKQNAQRDRYVMRAKKRTGKNIIKSQLEALEVWFKDDERQCIPVRYKTGQTLVRQGILAGLLDGRGNVYGDGGMAIYSQSRTLVDDIAYVARSLGFKANVETNIAKKNIPFRVCLYGDFQSIPRLVSDRQPDTILDQHALLLSPFTVKPVGTGYYFGFTVSDDHLYVLGDFTVTHNSGKTIMLSSVAGQWHEKMPGAKSCVLSHRDEINQQNAEKFSLVNPEASISFFDAESKDWGGDTIFAMMQTLSRSSHLKNIPKLDLLIIDEAHHVAAESYRNILDASRERNPEIKIYGVTATPERGDRQGLRHAFNNVADQIRIGELIKDGHLVPPQAFTIDIGKQHEFEGMANPDDMNELASILNHPKINELVIQHWKEKAGDRKTIVFCSNVDHAEAMCRAYQSAGINAAVVSDRIDKTTRRQILKDLEFGDLQVVLNCFVLAEGVDIQVVSCVTILRTSSAKSTFIQMVGRGLRTVDPERHPGVIKKDCIVLDFGTSMHDHETLEQDVRLEGSKSIGNGGQSQTTCMGCFAPIPPQSLTCPLCGATQHTEMLNEPRNDAKTTEVTPFVMTEWDLMKKSAFQWSDLYGDGSSFLATGFEAWSGNFFLEGAWYAVGGKLKSAPKLLAVGDSTIGFAAANDWLNLHETDSGARKSKKWLKQTATKLQLQYLPEHKSDFGLTRYQASCLIAFKFNRRAIKALVFKASTQRHTEEVSLNV